MHNGLRPYSCDACEKDFRTKYALDKHKRLLHLKKFKMREEDESKKKLLKNCEDHSNQGKLLFCLIHKKKTYKININFNVLH